MTVTTLSHCNTCGADGEVGVDFYPYLLTKCKPCHSDYQREYRQRSAGRAVTKDKKYMLKKRYGLSPERFEEMIEEQGGICAACGIDPIYCVDHDHGTEVVRGLLCNGCNRALGFISDDPQRAIGLALYLIQSEVARAR